MGTIVLISALRFFRPLLLSVVAFPRPFGQVGQFDRPLSYIAELASVGLTEFQAA
jgi:hypothetical protein